MIRIIGIDPGVNTGIALITNGVLVMMDTINPLDIYATIERWGAGRVVFEDSRLTSFLFTSNAKAAVAKSMARKVGQVDMVCSLIVTACDRLGIPAHGISPKGKGAKLDAYQFAKATGWTGKSNEHTRDACMVAWPYRGAK